MIAKISSGNSFGGCLRYVLRDGAARIGGNAAGKDPKELAREFETIAAQRKITGAVYHVSLALPEGERLSDEEWTKTAAQYLAKMGFAETNQFILVRHSDTKHDHAHIVVNRVATDGRVWNAFQDRVRSKAICRELEAKLNLSSPPNSRPRGAAKVSQAERRFRGRTGKTGPAGQELVSAAIAEVTEAGRLPVREFCAALEERGVTAVPNIAATGKMNGFAFRYEGRVHAGSTCGAAWKYLAPKLNELSLDDVKWLQERKKLAAAGTAFDLTRALRSSVWELAAGKTNALAAEGWTSDGNAWTHVSGTRVELPFAAAELEREARAIAKLSEAERKKAREAASKLARAFHGGREIHAIEAMPPEAMLGLLVFAPGILFAAIALQIVANVALSSGLPESEDELKTAIRAIYAAETAKTRERVKALQAEVKTARPEARAETKPKKDPEPISPRPEAGPAVETKAIPDAREKEPAAPKRRALRRDVGPDRIYMDMAKAGEPEGKIARRLFDEFLEKDARDTLSAAGWKEEAIGAAFEAFQTKAGRAELGRGDFFPDGIV